MKTITPFVYAVLFLNLVIFSGTGLMAQEEKSHSDLIRKVRDVGAFESIDVSGIFKVFLTQGESSKVEIEADAELMDHIKTDVKNGTLILSSNDIKHGHHLNAYITNPVFKSIEASGASEVRSETPLKEDALSLDASGASEVELNLEVNTLRTDISGASTVKLSGKAESHTIDVSGASTLKASDLVTQKTNADVSGAGSAYVTAEQEIIKDVSGAGSLHYSDASKVSKPSHNEESGEGMIYNEGDTTRVDVPGVHVEVVEGNDSVKVKMCHHVIVVDDDGHVTCRRDHKMRYNGNWGGVEIGLNGYVNKDFNMNFPKEYEYLDLRMEKSVAVNLNIYEQNIGISKNHKFGFTTGLGIGWNDYRFSRPTRLESDSSYLIGYLYDGVSIRKSKLTALYLNLPIIFEYQTNGWHDKRSFHVGLGVIVGARLLSYTKIYYNEYNKDYTLDRYNPETNQYEPVLTGTSPGYNKVHDYDDWFLRPFKFDATFRIGWGVINLFANYSINSMFRDGKGPVLYPWTVGICLVNW